jgi:hypothetical protein
LTTAGVNHLKLRSPQCLWQITEPEITHFSVEDLYQTTINRMSVAVGKARLGPKPSAKRGIYL